jgi:hypothetical protein
MSKYSKEDEKLVKEFLNNLYSQHKLTGGSAFTDFLHGFLTPFKQFGKHIPVIGKIIEPVAQLIDDAVPGSKYDTIGDILNNKPSGRGRGRPRKVKPEVQLVSSISSTKRKAGRPKGSKNKK